MRMRTAIAAGVATGAAALVLGAVALTASGPSKAVASSHREAPLIANDPTADLTDFYLFPSPEKAGTVTMIANVIPLEAPPEGPNYYNLDDSARYRFNIDWNGDGKAERTWTLRTKTTTAYPGTFLYNIGPVNSINDPNLSVRQTWTLWSQKGDGPSVKIGEGTTAPNNVGKNSFPNYEAVRQQAITTLANGTRVYVGPSEDPFAIDVGRIFDLIGVGGKGTDNLAGFNVHSIAIQVPLNQIRQSDKQPVIGGWAAVDRMVAGKSDSSSLGEAQHGREAVQEAPRADVCEALGAGRAPRSASHQRGDHPARPEGLLELGRSGQGLPVREVLHRSEQAGSAHQRAERPAPEAAPDRGARFAPGRDRPDGSGAGDRARGSLRDPAPRLQVPERLEGSARSDLRQGRRGQARGRAAAQHDDPGHAFRQGGPAWPDVQLRRCRRLPGPHGPGLQSCAVRRLSQRPAAR